MLLAFVMFASLAYRAFRASVVQSEPRLLLQSQRLCPVVLRLDAVLADDALVEAVRHGANPTGRLARLLAAWRDDGRSNA